MTESSGPVYYSLHTEAEQFIREWPDQWELDDQKAQTYTLTTWEGKKERTDSLLSLFLNAISGYKIALSNAAMHSKMVDMNQAFEKERGLFPNVAMVANNAVKIAELNNAGATLIDLKNRLEGVKALKRVPSPYKRIQELEESQEKINQTLASVNLAYTRLKKRIISERGERLGHEYIQKAITDSDDTVWEGEVVDGSEDDKHE